MQVQRATFDGMKRNGQLPAHADFANPNHTKRAGEIHAGYLFDKYGGNAMQAAAAYYGGEKAVKADGSIADFGNLQNPSHPTTLQYARQVVGRM